MFKKELNHHPQWKLCPDTITHETVTTFLVHFIFLSTCSHELTGNQILKYASDARKISTKIRYSDTISIEDMYPDRQTYKQATLMGLATSVGLVPRLLDDLGFLFPDDPDHKVLFKELRDNLIKFGATIDQRNKTRAVPFFGCHPEYLELSLSQ